MTYFILTCTVIYAFVPLYALVVSLSDPRCTYRQAIGSSLILATVVCFFVAAAWLGNWLDGQMAVKFDDWFQY